MSGRGALEPAASGQRRSASGRPTAAVLVLDVHPLMRDALADALSEGGDLEVVGCAATPDEGRELCATWQPAVAVMDAWDWPASAAETVEELREVAPEVRVIVIADDKPTLVDAVTSGAVGQVSPRADATELRGTVRAVLRGEHVLPPDLTAELMRTYARSRARMRDPMAEDRSAREQAVLRLMAEGRTDAEIAQELRLSRRTVQRALTEARRATGLQTRPALARWVSDQSFFRRER